MLGLCEFPTALSGIMRLAMGAECDYEIRKRMHFYPRRFVSSRLKSAWETVWTSGVKEFAAARALGSMQVQSGKDAIAVAPYDAVSPVEEERWQSWTNKPRSFQIPPRRFSTKITASERGRRRSSG